MSRKNLEGTLVSPAHEPRIVRYQPLVPRVLDEETKALLEKNRKKWAARLKLYSDKIRAAGRLTEADYCRVVNY